MLTLGLLFQRQVDTLWCSFQVVLLAPISAVGGREAVVVRVPGDTATRVPADSSVGTQDEARTIARSVCKRVDAGAGGRAGGILCSPARNKTRATSQQTSVDGPSKLTQGTGPIRWSSPIRADDHHHGEEGAADRKAQHMSPNVR